MSVAFVFPGQGSQSLGMLAELAATQSVVQSTFAEASEVLGYDLWRLVQEGPEEELSKTTVTQPALLAASVATWRVWNTISQVQPVIMAGHSLGEYSALVCSSALDFKDAIQLVADRAAYMQNAVPAGTGSMAAVLGLEDGQVEQLCEQAAQGQVVAVANYNSCGQVVIAGHKEAVERAVALARAASAKRSIILSVSVPSHCELMQEAADKIAVRLDTIEFNQPVTPVLHNVDARSRENIDEIKQALQAQLCRPVRWVDTIKTMISHDVRTIIECGPGKVLSGLIKRIDQRLNILPVFDTVSLERALTELAT